MSIELFDSARALSDGALLEQLPRLAARERSTNAELIAHLAELEARRLHITAGYPSTSVYCREALRLTEREAYNRIEVSRVARRFPAVLEMLVAGVASLTAIRVLAPHLTEENQAEVLAAARGLTTRQVEELVARLAPRPDAPTVVRKSASPFAREQFRRAACSGGGQEGGVPSRPRPLRVRRAGRPWVRHSGVPGIPPCASVLRRRSGDGAEHRAALSRAQCRGMAAAVHRSPPARRGVAVRPMDEGATEADNSSRDESRDEQDEREERDERDERARRRYFFFVRCSRASSR